MDQSISILHNTCYEAFGSLLEASSVDEKYSEQLPYNVLIDLLGRFNVWAGNIGAGQQGRASLDYRLREAEYIKEAVLRLLKHLSEAIHDAKSIISGRRLPYDEISSDTESSDSSGLDDLERDASGEIRVESEIIKEDPLRTELQQLQHSISSSIKNLYQISILVRRNPVPHDRLVKSAKIDTAFYEEFDKRHVHEKFPHASLDLVERLGKAISKRRKFFKYREQHRQKLSFLPNNGAIRGATQKLQMIPTTQSRSQSQTIDVRKAMGTERDTPSLPQSTNAKESTTASTFVVQPSQFPLNLDTIDQQSDAATQTTHHSTSSMSPDHLNIPKAPKASQDADEFECPYCYTIYRFRARDSYKRKREWEQHVLRDLQPYLCTFGGCSQSNTLYERQREWMNHEVQHHRREWSCNAPGHDVFKDRNDFEAHMSSQHKDSYEKEQLDGIIDMLERPAASSRFPCLLCLDERYKDLDLEQLKRHLGHHLQVLATFALPSTGYESRASDDSVIAQDARRTDSEGSQDVETSQENIIYMDDRDHRKVGVYNDIDSAHGNPSELKSTYLHDLSVFRYRVENHMVSKGFAERCLQSWTSNSSSSLVRSIGQRILEELQDRTEAEAETASLPLNELVERVLQHTISAVENMHGREQIISTASSELDSLVRNCLISFTTSMIQEFLFREEKNKILLDCLQQLEVQLHFPTASEAPLESDQDWRFLDAPTSLSEEFVNTDGQEVDDTLRNCYQWLAPTDPSPYLSRVLDRVCPGTNLWYREAVEYEQFRSGVNRVLLIEGLPGCGKTYLFARIIEVLLLEANSDEGLGFAYYFVWRGPNSETTLLRTLVCQLLIRAGSIPPILQATIENFLEPSTLLSVNRLCEILEELVSSFTRIILAIDGLDRIKKSSIQMLSSLIRRLWDRGVNIQLLATSRISIAVDDAFWNPTSRLGAYGKTLNITREITQKDIQIYVNDASMDLRPRKKRRQHTDWIVGQSNGIFTLASIWARGYQTYDPPLSQIEDLWWEIVVRVLDQSQAAGKVEVVRQILNLLSVCKRPLDPEEIDGYLRCGSINMSDKLDIWRQCPALCELATQPQYTGNEKFGLVHDSLKDFLQRSSIEALAVNEDQAQSIITSRCLAELLKYENPDSYKSKYGWTAYAGTYWHVHAKNVLHNKAIPRDTINRKFCTRLLRSDTPSFAHWIHMTRWRGDVDKDERGDFGKKDTYPSALYYAALLGLIGCVEELIHDGEDVNVKGGKHRFPILAAVMMGEVEIVRLLLANGADSNSRYANGDYALSRTIKLGHKDIFKTLIAAGATFEGRNKKPSINAAHQVVRYNRPELLEALLIAGANPDPYDQFHKTPLFWAVQCDSITNIRLLLSVGADLETQDMEGLRPLHIAATGSLSTLALLLQHGANVNAATSTGKTPLAIAAGQANIINVQQLLNKGANVDIPDSDMRTPLHIAATPLENAELPPSGTSFETFYEGKRRIIRLLLNYCANPSVRDRWKKRPEDIAKDPLIKASLRSARREASQLYSISDEVYVNGAGGSRGPFEVDEVLRNRKYRLRNENGERFNEVYDEDVLSFAPWIV